jgi:hypothetical protein
MIWSCTYTILLVLMACFGCVFILVVIKALSKSIVIIIELALL